MDGLLRSLHQHYSTLASKKELSFEEFLAQRVALKAREFNTAVNAPGLTDELKQNAKDAGPEAYRKASRGD